MEKHNEILKKGMKLALIMEIHIDITYQYIKSDKYR